MKPFYPFRMWLCRLGCLASALFLLGLSAVEIAPPEALIFGLPGEPDQLLIRRGFIVGYSYRRRQAAWVSYILIASQVNGGKVPRPDRFRADPEITFRPVSPRDYDRTGYDRGHLAPAADMAYAEEAMAQSFWMSNISPQLPGCNRGIWKRLEIKVRQWAAAEGKLCVITGPIFSADASTMGSADIPVPEAFFKVIWDMTPPEKMIAFIIPNAPSKRRLAAFAVSVDQVEELTGYDFFREMEDERETRLEKEADIRAWR